MWNPFNFSSACAAAEERGTARFAPEQLLQGGEACDEYRLFTRARLGSGIGLTVFRERL
jgi:hypothetical protein